MSTKICIKCSKEKTYDQFGTRSKNIDGKRGRCKECEKVDRNVYLSTPRAQAIRIATSKKWYGENRDYNIKRHKKWCDENKEKRAEWTRKNLLSKYGLTVYQYNAMAVAQDYKCKICKSLTPGHNSKFLYIDHCHRTNKVWGLLCVHCNMAIGQFKDNENIILRAAAYIREEGNI